LAVWFSWRVAGLVAVAAGLLVASPGPALATPGGATVFVQSAKGGEVRGGRLILRGVGRQLTWVTNGGRSGAVSVARLHRRLFPSGTPAATGVLHIAGRLGRAVALRLTRPRYSASRHRVSYRAMPLSKGRRRGRVALAPVPRRFGAASLSILGAPAVLGGTSGGHDCSAGFLNHTLYDVETVSSSKLKTDIWSPEVRPGTLIEALTGTADWGSSGGPLLGCSNSTVWEFAANSAQPNPPSGTFTITTTYPWTGPFSNTCTSSNPQYTCRAGASNPGQVLWEIRPSL
jgi:hypothetical protein